MELDNLAFTSLDHMTHIDNLASIFKYGLLSHSNSYKKRDISNIEVNQRRERRENVYGRKIHDYVPFYFNPRNAMMYRNRDEDIVILAFSKKLLLENNVIFTDKNAATSTVEFYHNIDDLDKINWEIVQSQSWCCKPEYVKQIMMAEALVYDHVGIENLLGIYCKNNNVKNMLMQAYSLKSHQVAVKPNLFFKY